MSLGSVYQATIIQEVHATRLSNVFYFQQTTADGPVESKQDLGDALDATWRPIWAAALGAAWLPLCAEISDVLITGQAFFRVLMTATPGTAVGVTLNAATVATIATFTAFGGRQGTGRSFISGITDVQENRNNLSAAGLTAMDTISNAIIAPLTTPNGVIYQSGRYSDTPSPTFDPWILEDVRVPTTKLRSRRQSTKC